MRAPASRLRTWAILVAALFCAGCASSASVKPFESGADAETLLEDENRYWSMSDELDRALEKSGSLFGDERLDAYLQEITDSLFPEFSGKLRVRAIRDTNLNAFAMANGSIYFNTGMLARLENEAELANILGHEGAHFTGRHVVKGVRNAKGMSVFTQVASIGAGPLGGLGGDLLSASSISGFSQSMEAEADQQGFERLHAAGYDVTQAGESFARFSRELKALDVKSPIFFRSHPKMDNRAKSFAKLAAEVPSGGITNRERFLEVTESARMAVLAEAVAKGEHEFIIHHLVTENRALSFPPSALHYLGEAYRTRGDEGDLGKAIDTFRSFLSTTPDFGPSHGALGYCLMKTGDRAAARKHFERYLELEPNAVDRGYIETYITQLKEEEP